MIAIIDCKALLLKTLTWNLIFKLLFEMACLVKAWQPKFDFRGSDGSFLTSTLKLWHVSNRVHTDPLIYTYTKEHWMCVVRRKLAEICSSLFYHVGSRDQTLVLKLGGKCLYLPTHLAGPDLKLWLQACFWGNISPLIRLFKTN